MIMDILAQYENLLKDEEEQEPVRASQIEPVQEGQVREFLYLTPERFLVVKEIEKDLFVVVPLTNRLAFCSGLGLLVKRKDGKEFVFCPLPGFANIHRETIENYSVVMDKLTQEDTEKVWQFVKGYDKSKLPAYKKRFLEFVLERFSRLQGAVKHAGQVIKLKDSVISKIATERLALAPAAQPSKVLEGKNWLGFIEEGRLVLYLPKEFVGKEVCVKYEEEVLFEGFLEAPKLVLENLPKVNSYDFLEERLYVELCSV